MPWTTNDPPPPAKNWSRQRRKRCVAAANDYLARHPSDEQGAVFACIGAAKRKIYKQERLSPTTKTLSIYEKESRRTAEIYQTLVEEYLSGRRSQSSLAEDFSSELRAHHLRTALIARDGKPLTEFGKRKLQEFVTKSLSFLDGFLSDLSLYKEIKSDRQALARASSYSRTWGVYVSFSVPGALAAVLPALPGVDCLGLSNCGCILEYALVEGGFEVFWIINPLKEHCVLCSEYAVEWSPLFVPFSDVEDEFDVDGVFDEDGELIDF